MVRMAVTIYRLVQAIMCQMPANFDSLGAALLDLMANTVTHCLADEADVQGKTK